MTREEKISLLIAEIKFDDDMLHEIVEEAVKNIEIEPKWIPVSERLPEENGGYLVTVKRGYVTTALWVGTAEFWNEVTAWMPLPQPYDPQESEVSNADSN